MISQLRYLWLWIALATAWVCYGFLLVAQMLRLRTADPTADTGLSFGFAFLLRVVGPALLVATLVYMVLMFIRQRKTGGQK